MLFAGREVRIAKNYDRGPENAARSGRSRAASSKSHFFTIHTDPMPVLNSLFIFSSHISFIIVSFSTHTSRAVP